MDSIHLNFDLAIEETEDGYFTRVVDSPVGKGTVRFVSPLSPQDLDQAWAALEASAGGHPGPDHPGLMRSVGRRLFKALFSGELLNLYRASMRMAYQAQAGLRLHLDLSQAPAFEPLPWEYLYDPERNEFLGLSIHAPITRHIDRMYRIDSYTVEPPLRVLVAVAEPDTYAQFGGERKWLDLIDAIDYLARDRRLLLERLKKPTLFELQRRLRQGDHHVFHFIGHSFLEPNSRDGLLVMEDEIGRGRTISGQHLGTLLHDHYPLRLVVLQSCDDFADGLYDNPFALAANQIVTRGVPAAIALPMAMPAAPTTTFLQNVYAALANYRPVDMAVTEGRIAMQRREEGVLWGAPLLYSRAPDERLFDNGDLLQWRDTLPQPHEPSLWERVMKMGRR